jgi:hypothetical protein
VIQFSKTYSTPIKLTHVISDRQVVDVASIDHHLFVLRYPSLQQIEVYDTKTFKQQRALQVPNLSDDTVFSGLTSCVIDNCVYVSDWCKCIVYKVELSGTSKVFSWSVDRYPRGLSINASCNLLVTCRFADKIQEYTASGSLVREVCLKSNDVELHPYHSIQLTSDQFVVSCWNVTNQEYDVVEVDTKGRVVVSYANQLQSTTHQQFEFPRRLSVDRNNECIFVADFSNNRIVMLNRSLNCCARVLNVVSVDRRLQTPSCLHFDMSRNRLFVGEWTEPRRVLVFDDVI